MTPSYLKLSLLFLTSQALIAQGVPTEDSKNNVVIASDPFSIQQTCDQSKVNEYDYTTKIQLWKEPEVQTGTFSAKIYTSCVRERAENGVPGNLYEMRFNKVFYHSLEGNRNGYTPTTGKTNAPPELEDLSDKFKIPVYFTRFHTGEISTHVYVSKQDPVEISNTKKAILSEWRGKFLSNQLQSASTSAEVKVLEAHPQGTVEASYSNFRASGASNMVQMSFTYTADNFKSIVPTLSLNEKGFVYEVKGTKEFSPNGELQTHSSKELFNFAGAKNAGNFQEVPEGEFRISSDQPNLKEDMFQGQVFIDIKLKQTNAAYRVSGSLNLDNFVEETMSFQPPTSSKTMFQKRSDEGELPTLDDYFFSEWSKKPHDPSLLDSLQRSVTRSDDNFQKLVQYLDTIETTNMALLTAAFTVLAASGRESSHSFLSKKLLHSSSDERLSLIQSLVFMESPSVEILETMKSVLSQKHREYLSQESNLFLAFGVALGRSTGLIEEHLDFLLNELSSAQLYGNTERTVLLLLTLGNMRERAPKESIVTFLRNRSADIRRAAAIALKDHYSDTSIREAIAAMVTDERDFSVLSYVLSTELLRVKNERIGFKHDILEQALWNNYKQFGTTYDDGLSKLFLEFSQHLGEDISSSLGIHKRALKWEEDKSNYDLVLPISNRREDVANFPHNKAFIEASKFGPDVANLQAGMGFFAGANTEKGCGQAKLYGRLITQAKLFTSSFTVGDVLAFGSVGGVTSKRGDSFKAYAMIAGITLMDFKHTVECKSDSKPLVPAKEFTVVKAPTVFPISIFTLSFELNALAGFRLDLDYEYCASLPKAQASVVPKVMLTLTADAGVGVIGIVKGGLGLSGQFSYKLAGTVRIGAVGEKICGACIALQHGFDPMKLNINLFVKALAWTITKKVVQFDIPMQPLTDIAKACINLRGLIPSEIHNGTLVPMLGENGTNEKASEPDLQKSLKTATTETLGMESNQ